MNKRKPSKIPDTNYTLHFNPPGAFKAVDQRLHAFNKACVAPTQDCDVIHKNFLVKEGNKTIAGICADIYVWKILYISVFFIEEAYRHQGLGTLLLHKVEEEAKAFGVSLIHLDTFDFQAKNFYLKHGYEIFGILEDCPQGHKRYYMKKVLSS